VAPTPDPQRLLPSLNVEHTRPALQSPSLEQVSHSPPLDWQLPAGTASRTRDSSAYRVRFIGAPAARDCSDAGRSEARKAFGLTGFESAC
jgi:hypothetical protein